MIENIHSFVSMLVVTLFLLGVSFPLSAQKQDDVERRILVMFQPNSARLPEGRDRGGIGEAVLPVRVKQLLQEARAEEIAKGIPRFKQADTLRVLNDGRIYKTPDYTNLFVIRLPRGVERQAVIDSLKGQPAVAIVEKDQRPIFRELVPDDTHFNLQWNLKNTGQFGGAPGADIKATQAWDITTGSNTVKLGFIDTGVQGNHPDFSNRVSGDSQFLTDHGTAVAGVAAATGNNSIGVAGVDWNAAIHAESIDDFHISNVTAIIAAIDDAVTAGARVLNNSWGIAGFSQLLSDQFLAAYQADVLPIISNPQDASAGEYPNLFGSWILNVAATTNGDAQASYSFSRDYTDVAAPGGNADGDERHDIYSTIRTSQGSYDYVNGTSYAAPHVTGIAGLLLAVNPNLRNYDLEWIIKRSADDKGVSGPDPEFGYGRVNAYEAVRHVSPPYEISRGNATLSKTNNDIPVNFIKRPLPELAAGFYVVDRWMLEAVVSFSYMEVPWAWLSQVAYSAATPNDASFYMYENSSTTSTTVRTFFYFLESNIDGPINKWAPVDPNLLPLKYAVLGASSITYDFTVAGGAWYFISLPVIPEDRSLGTLFPEAISAFGWDYATQSYVAATVLEPERGYWLLMPVATTAEVSGVPLASYTNNYTQQGYDLVGSVWQTSPVVDDPPGSVIAMFGWDPLTQSYVAVNPFTVQPKQGYWILVFSVPSTVSVGGGGAAARQASSHSQAELALFYEKYGRRPPIPPFVRKVPKTTVDMQDQTSEPIPQSYGLSQSYPNPFNPETVIEYQLPNSERVSIKVYTILGQLVRTLVNEEKTPGIHRVVWDARDDRGRLLPSGVYLYRLEAGDFSDSRKVILLK